MENQVSSASYRSSHNDSMGDWYEKIAEKFFSELLNEELLERNGTHGIDLIFPSQKIEVKGIESLIQKIKINRSQIRNWKIKKNQINRETTLYAFVLSDKIFFPKPIIFTVRAKTVHKRLDENLNSTWIWFPLWWIVENFDHKFSRYPAKLGGY